jgi:hypothetical protein
MQMGGLLPACANLKSRLWEVLVSSEPEILSMNMERCGLWKQGFQKSPEIHLEGADVMVPYPIQGAMRECLQTP